ncbi:MAG TPA: tetratricopeptide repeat protein [Candidatus Polarisedimenticolaceae bacterium]|nr:tetratricopeptide repeat protein [Candidatus Polarisedimenticolaceae bacterium]
MAGRRWIVGLGLLGLALRLLHLVTIRDSPFSTHLMLDPRFYDAWAQQIVAGTAPADRAFFQDPLYAYVLAAIYAVAGHRPLLVLALQLVLGAGVAPLVLAGARRWVGEAAARTAGVLAAIYPPSIFYEGILEKTALTTVLLALAFALASRALTHRRPRPWLLVGALLGLAALNRGNLVLVVPLCAAALGARRGWACGGLLLAGTACVIAPVTLRNRLVGGEWVLTTANAGQNFFIGNNPSNTVGDYQPLPFVGANPLHEERDFEREAERRAGRDLRPGEVSRYWMREGLAWVRSAPGAWLALGWRKLRSYWGIYEVPDNLDYYLYRRTAPVLRWPLPGFGVVAPLGLLGLVLAVRRNAWLSLLALFVAGYVASVVAFFVFARFRMAMMPALFVFAGVGAVELLRRARLARGGSWKPLGIAASAGLAAMAFVDLPVRGPADSLPFRWAQALRLPTRPETSATAHYNLGLAYASAAKDAAEDAELLHRAEEELRSSLQEDSRWAKVHLELGKVLARQGRNAEAIACYRRGLELEPAQYVAWHALGLLERRVGDPAAAESAFRRALQLQPRHAPSATRLGEVLLEQGRPAEAAAAFSQALALDPRDAAARAGLERSRQ